MEKTPHSNIIELRPAEVEEEGPDSSVPGSVPPIPREHYPDLYRSFAERERQAGLYPDWKDALFYIFAGGFTALLVVSVLLYLQIGGGQ